METEIIDIRGRRIQKFVGSAHYGVQSLSEQCCHGRRDGIENLSVVLGNSLIFSSQTQLEYANRVNYSQGIIHTEGNTLNRKKQPRS